MAAEPPILCGICKRLLNDPADPLSTDCGGDCWGCVGEAEALGGYPPSLRQIHREIATGIRQPIPNLPKISAEDEEDKGEDHS